MKRPPRTEAPKQRLLDTDEAAAFLGTSPGTLKVERCRPTWGLPWVRLGKRGVRYDLGDLEAFIAAHRNRPDTETGGEQ
jgi:hypothetical protein